MTDWTSSTYAVVDVEGNGQQPPELVELAVVPVVGGTVGEPVSWLVRPATPITPIASRVHGLTSRDVAEHPPVDTVRSDILAALAHPAIVAHNAHVDVGVLRRTLPGWQPPEVFDTLTLARRLLPGLPSYRLGALVETYHLVDGLPPGLSPHRATYDALVAARLFKLLAAKATDLDDLRGHRTRGGTDERPTLFSARAPAYWHPRVFQRAGAARS